MIALVCFTLPSNLPCSISECSGLTWGHEGGLRAPLGRIWVPSRPTRGLVLGAPKPPGEGALLSARTA